MTNAANRLRISCAGLCRIRDARGFYLLGLNRDRASQGKAIYMPLGGALHYHAPDLLTRFEATPEDAATNDLRLFINPAHLDAFRAWYLRREERETSAYRELVEELVDEFAVLPALPPDDVQIAYTNTYEARAITDRHNAIGQLTHYLHDIFDVEFRSPIARAALENAAQTTGLRWFSTHELQTSLTADGASLDGRALL